MKFVLRKPSVVCSWINALVQKKYLKISQSDSISCICKCLWNHFQGLGKLLKKLHYVLLILKPFLNWTQAILLYIIKTFKDQPFVSSCWNQCKTSPWLSFNSSMSDLNALTDEVATPGGWRNNDVSIVVVSSIRFLLAL